MTDGFHKPVLANETLRFLITEPNGIYVDGTIGGGGHAAMILEKLLPEGILIGFDEDAEALETAGKKLSAYRDQIKFRHDNFANIKSGIRELGFDKVNGVLFDLGVSSYQIDNGIRGFSFQSDGPLDMRMNQTQKKSALEIINSYSKEELSEIFREYGEERFASHIAGKIVKMREKQFINTTELLVAIIEQSVSQRFLKKSLARIFQAIRIEVNNELENLKIGLKDAIDVLVPGGRIVILSYHSLEDRIVKEIFRKESQKIIPSGNKIIPDRILMPRLQLLVKKPIEARKEEIDDNPRARSAKLRAAERV